MSPFPRRFFIRCSQCQTQLASLGEMLGKLSKVALKMSHLKQKCAIKLLANQLKTGPNQIDFLNNDKRPMNFKEFENFSLMSSNIFDLSFGINWLSVHQAIDRNYRVNNGAKNVHSHVIWES